MGHNKRNAVIGASGGMLFIFLIDQIRRRKMKKVTSKGIDLEKATNSLKTITEAVKERGENEMTRIEKEEFVNRIKGMSQEELELVVDIIPVDLCVARVNKELERLRTFENSVKWAVNGGIL